MAIATQLFGRTKEKGETIFHQGDPGDEMYIIQSGAVEVSKLRQGRKVVLTLLEKGDFFGEVALLDSKPRSAAVTAITRTRLLPLSRNTFLKRIAYNPDVVLRVLRAVSRRLDRMTETIRSLIDSDVKLRQKVFSGSYDVQDDQLLPGDSIVQTNRKRSELSQSKDEETRWVSSPNFGMALHYNSKNPISFQSNQIIFTQGDTGHNMYLIVRGMVEIFQSGQNGDEVRMALLGPGDCFGEMALITGDPRTASARANSAVTLLPVNREDMLNGIRSDPD